MKKMKHCSPPVNSKTLSLAISLALTAGTGHSLAQDDGIEEVVVTGSYIRNSAFAENSPVDTVTQADLFESGAPGMGQYIRDLSYTQNTNVMNIVLGSSDGAQNAVNTSFNLRGLGENSTLTLVDSTRSVSPGVQASIPEIAIERLELVLDGGSALYGSDAVAGVVNLVPIKEFDGFRMRSYYQTTQDRAMEEMTLSTLWGRAFSNGIDYVGSLEFKNRTSLMMYERTREWKNSNNASNSGPIGAYREIEGADPGINLLAPHGGTHVGDVLRDPSCQTFNEGFPAHGEGPNSNPSGTFATGNRCTYEYSIQHPYMPHEQAYTLYNSLSYNFNGVDLNATLYNHYRFNNRQTTGSSPNGGNDRAVMKVPANHPANPWGVDLTPWAWRVFGNTGATLPTVFNADSSKAARYDYALNRFKVQAEYDFSGSWTGYTYYSGQDDKSMNDQHVISSSRLQLAMSGMGGPNGDEWFNPFGSASPLSPYYVEGVTGNSQELIDWLMLHNDNQITSRNRLQILETVATGELFDLPHGAVQMAIGAQIRDLEQEVVEDPFDYLGEDYANSQILGARQENATFESFTSAVFMEMEIPILENLDAQLAVRTEEFVDFGLNATTPKVALRYEASPSVALRASWGESFLAPSPYQARPFVEDDTCADMYSGIDEISGDTLIGGIWCQSGNPNLRPETSTIQNLGLTWQPEGQLDGLTVSLDYQEIEYTDRIRTLSQQDTVGKEFTEFLNDTGIARENYDPTPGSATRAAADAWLAEKATIPGYPIRRYPNGSVSRLFVQSANISSVWVDLIDANVEYNFLTDNYGSFAVTLQATNYLTYDYEGLLGGRQEALGNQNGRTGIVPPIPETKANLRLNWFRGNHSASLSTNYWSTINFDDQVVDLYPADGDNTMNELNPDKIKGETIVDARYAMVLEDFLLDGSFTVSLGVNNLFDKRPQVLGIIGGFESRLSTNFGRQYWMSLDWTPGG